MQCSEEQWPSVNGVAHQIRSSCFPWYFSWLETAEETADFAAALRYAGLRFQLEHYQDRDVFLLPKADRAKHHEMKLDLRQEED